MLAASQDQNKSPLRKREARPPRWVSSRRFPISEEAKETGFCPSQRQKMVEIQSPRRRANAVLAKLFPYLSFGRWGVSGCVRGRQLFQEIKLRGYTGGYSHLERLLATWRDDRSAKAAKNDNDHTVANVASDPQPPTESASVRIPRAVDPVTSVGRENHS